MINHGKHQFCSSTVALIAIIFIFLCSITYFTRVKEVHINKEWDVLIFTQHWPNTVCLMWEEKYSSRTYTGDSNHTCSFPRHNGSWSIHGIWPTKFGTIGPVFCNASYHFNSSQLAPIEANLTDYWVDIERPHTQYAFWRHEWRKHGTCAMVLPQLDTEVKYFTQGLEWIQDYNMVDVLKKGGIVPSDDTAYEASAIADAARNVLGKNPAVQCVHDLTTGQSFLFELRICFDKNLELTDCDGIRGYEQSSFWSSNIITNCPLGQPIQYPLTLPSPNRKPLQLLPEHKVVSAFKIIRFFDWITS